MLNSLHRHFALGGRQSAGETERLVRLAKILTWGVAAAAGVYFALLYLVVGR
jgi:hypothetical protein